MRSSGAVCRRAHPAAHRAGSIAGTGRHPQEEMADDIEVKQAEPVGQGEAEEGDTGDRCNHPAPRKALREPRPGEGGEDQHAGKNRAPAEIVVLSGRADQQQPASAQGWRRRRPTAPASAQTSTAARRRRPEARQREIRWAAGSASRPGYRAICASPRARPGWRTGAGDSSTGGSAAPRSAAAWNWAARSGKMSATATPPAIASAATNGRRLPGLIEASTTMPAAPAQSVNVMPPTQSELPGMKLRQAPLQQGIAATDGACASRSISRSDSTMAVAEAT